MRLLLSVAVLLAPAPAAAQLRDGLCHDLRLIVAAASEREPFDSVAFHENWRRFRLFEMCRPNRYEPVDRVSCSWRLASNQRIVEAMAAEAARCLPRAQRDDAGGIVPPHWAEVRFELGDLAIYLEQSVATPNTLGASAAVVIVIDEGGG